MSGYVDEYMLTVAEAAEFLEVPEAWLRDQAYTMRINYVAHGKDIMFKRSDLENWSIRGLCQTCALWDYSKKPGGGCKCGAGGNPSGGGCYQSALTKGE